MIDLEMVKTLRREVILPPPTASSLSLVGLVFTLFMMAGSVAFGIIRTVRHLDTRVYAPELEHAVDRIHEYYFVKDDQLIMVIKLP